MQVEVVVRGDEEAQDLLSRLARRLEDGRPQLLGLVDMLLGAQRERFLGRGSRWKRLAPATIREHRRHGLGPAPLILTGTLMRSITQRGAPGQVVRVTPTTLTFGTRIWYAKFAHRGIGEPRRTVVGLTRVHRKNVVAQLRDLLLEDL